LCAAEFGWTTEQVDNTPAHLVDWLTAIHGIVQEVKASKQNG
jgi:hypothetical protein